MTDIDRCVEIATHLDFIAFTEGHPYPTDYEPEPICCVCGDEPVETEGRACDYCVNSDDDEMRAMAAKANATHPEVAHV